MAVMMLIAWWNPGISEAQYTHSQLTTTTGEGSYTPSISADGTKIAFRSNRNLTGGNPDGNWEIFLWTAGSGFTQVTNTTGESTYSYLSMSADGAKIAFRSTRDLVPGGNLDGNYEIFLWTSGSGFTQVTATTGGENFAPSISADGTKIAFGSDRNLVPGGNLDGNPEIFFWTAGSGFTQVTATSGVSTHYNPSINADGTRVVFYSTHDLTGGNPDNNSEIFLWTAGFGVAQVTTTTGGGSDSPSISADGNKIAFVSTSNPTGGNPDGNYEIFLWTSGSGFTQVTATTGGYNWQPSISADGNKIAFRSTRNLTGGNPDSNPEIFLWTAVFGFAQLTTTTAGDSSDLSLNTDGTRIAFVSTSNLTGGNSDGNPEIFLAGSPSVELDAVGSGPGPTLTNPVSVSYTLQGCSDKEIFLVVNAPAMGMPWSYLGASGWVPLPAGLSTVTPYLSSGQADGTYPLYAGTAPAGTYELYLGCDYVMDGHLNIDTSAGLSLNGVYDYLSVTVQ
jgi:Tol biopolymer transport system component